VCHRMVFLFLLDQLISAALLRLKHWSISTARRCRWRNSHGLYFNNTFISFSTDRGNVNKFSNAYYNFCILRSLEIEVVVKVWYLIWLKWRSRFLQKLKHQILE